VCTQIAKVYRDIELSAKSRFVYDGLLGELPTGVSMFYCPLLPWSASESKSCFGGSLASWGSSILTEWNEFGFLSRIESLEPGTKCQNLRVERGEGKDFSTSYSHGILGKLEKSKCNLITVSLKDEDKIGAIELNQGDSIDRATDGALRELGVTGITVCHSLHYLCDAV
jgi:hypothetical protein